MTFFVYFNILLRLLVFVLFISFEIDSILCISDENSLACYAFMLRPSFNSTPFSNKHINLSEPVNGFAQAPRPHSFVETRLESRLGFSTIAISIGLSVFIIDIDPETTRYIYQYIDAFQSIRDSLSGIGDRISSYEINWFGTGLINYMQICIPDVKLASLNGCMIFKKYLFKLPADLMFHDWPRLSYVDSMIYGFLHKQHPIWHLAGIILAVFFKLLPLIYHF